MATSTKVPLPVQEVRVKLSVPMFRMFRWLQGKGSTKLFPVGVLVGYLGPFGRYARPVTRPFPQNRLFSAVMLGMPEGRKDVSIALRRPGRATVCGRGLPRETVGIIDERFVSPASAQLEYAATIMKGSVASSSAWTDLK